MLTTTGRNDFGIELYGTQSLVAVSGSSTRPPYFAMDATVTIYPGTASYNGGLIPWDGTQTQVNHLSNFSGSSDMTHWQYTLLSLKKNVFYQVGDTQVGLDMTKTCSITAPSRAALVNPTATGNYPVALLTLYSATGSDSTLVEYIRY